MLPRWQGGVSILAFREGENNEGNNRQELRLVRTNERDQTARFKIPGLEEIKDYKGGRMAETKFRLILCDLRYKTLLLRCA